MLTATNETSKNQRRKRCSKQIDRLVMLGFKSSARKYSPLTFVRWFVSREHLNGELSARATETNDRDRDRG